MKNTKKILLFALALVALTLVLSISIFAREIEVTNASQFVAATDWGKDNTKTPTVDNLAVKEGDVIRLMNDISISTYVTVWEGITIDLNGYTLTTSYAYSSIWLKSSGCSIISSRNNPETGKPGKINHIATVCAIKVWQAKEIKDIDIECSRDCSSSAKGIGGIVLQESVKTRIDSISNVKIYGIGLTNGIETYNCGNATQDVIGSMDNVTINATNDSSSDAFGMKICAPVGTVENCTIYGEDAGIFLWNKNAAYVSTVTLEDCEVSGGVAINVQLQLDNCPITLKADPDTVLESENGGAPIVNTPHVDKDGKVLATLDSSELTLNVPSVDFASGSFTACTHANGYTTYESCAKPSVCVDCGAINPDVAVNHVNVEIEYKAPTADAAGYRRYECSVCGNTSKTIIPARPEHTHTPVEIPAVLPTPSKVGYTAGVKCSECGDVLEAPVEIPALGIDANYAIKSAALNLGDCLNMIYKTSVPAGYAKPYMVFVFNGQETTVTEYTIEDKTGYYCFKFPGITPLYMGENIHATLYANVNGEEVSKVIPSFGVKTYCQQMMTLYKNDAAMITLISDLLTYGAQAQLYFNINTDNLVTSGLTLKPSTFATLDSSYNKMALKGTADGMVTWTSATLNLGNTTNMIFKFKATDIEGLEIKVTINGRTQYLDVSEMKATGGVYEAKFTNITALEFNDIVTATAVKNGVESTQYVTFSINSYVYSCQSYTGTDSDMLALVALNKAMYNYGASAAAYFKK